MSFINPYIKKATSSVGWNNPREERLKKEEEKQEQLSSRYKVAGTDQMASYQTMPSVPTVEDKEKTSKRPYTFDFSPADVDAGIGPQQLMQKSTVAGMGDVTTGVLNAPRAVERAGLSGIANLQSKLTGKDVQPAVGPFEKLTTPILESQEKTRNEVSKGLETLPFAGRVVSGGIRSLPQMLPILTGASQAQALGFIGTTAFGGEARQAEQSGATPEQAFVSGLASAGTEVATEALPLQNLNKIIKGQGNLGLLAVNAVEEFVGESLAEAVAPVIESVYNENATKEAYTTNLKQTAARIGEAGLTGAVGSVLISGAAMGVSPKIQTLDNPTPENLTQTIKEVEARAKAQGKMNAEFESMIRQALMEVPNMETPANVSKALNDEIGPLPPMSQENVSETTVEGQTVQDTDTKQEYGYKEHGFNEKYRQKASEMKQEYIEDGKKDKTYLNKITASFKKPVDMSMDFLVENNQGGLRSEEVNLDQDKVNDLKESIKQDGLKEPIVVSVDFNGDAYIYEGNHRLAAAKELGLESIPTEIRWHDGGEQVSETWNPDSISNLSAETDVEAQLKVAREEVINQAIKDRALEVEGELERTQKGRRLPIINASSGNKHIEGYMGEPRVTSPTIEKIHGLREKMQYSTIERAIRNIQKGKSTKIANEVKEILRNEVENGFEAFEGSQIPKNRQLDLIDNGITQADLDMIQEQTGLTDIDKVPVNELLDIKKELAEPKPKKEKKRPRKQRESIPTAIEDAINSVLETDYQSVEEIDQAIEKINELESNTNAMQMDLTKFSDAKSELQKLKAQMQMSVAEIESKGTKERAYAFPEGRMGYFKKEIQQMYEQDKLTYTQLSNKKTIEAATKIVKQNPLAVEQLIRSKGTYDNALESAAAQEYIQELTYDENIDTHEKAFDLMEIHSGKLKKAGQVTQIASMWNKSSPEAIVNYVKRIKKEAERIGKKIKVPEGFEKELFEEVVFIRKTDNPLQLAKEIEKASNQELPNWVKKELNSMDTERLQTLAMEQVIQKIADLEPPSFWRKVSTAQAMSHLLNARTASRNVLANASFNEVERISNYLAIPFDRLMALKTGKRIVASPTARRKTLSAGKNRAKQASLRLELGLPALMESKYNVRKTFDPTSDNKFERGFAAMEKTMAYELQVADEFQKGIIKEDILDQYRRLTGEKDVPYDIIKLAEEEARYRTFQDDSLPASMMQGTKEVLNRAGFGKTHKKVGSKYLKEFGPADFLIKYPRVPGNIISRVVEYTPLGTLKALERGYVAYKSNDIQAQRQATMGMARSMTGSSMIGAGVLLAKLGLLLRADNDEDNEVAMEKAAGLGNYKVNISGIRRLLNGESPALQEDDLLSSYNFLEPISKSFAIGAAINDEVGNGLDHETFLNIGNKTLQEIIDIPTLSVIQSMTYYEGFESLIVPFTNAASGFVPAPVRQGARAIDPALRQQWSGGPLESAKKQIRGSIPILSKTLEPYLSPTGEERTSNVGTGLHLLNELVLPSNFTRYKPSQVLEPLQEFEDAIDNSTIPKDKIKTLPYLSGKTTNELSIDGETIEMTDELKTVYLKARNQYAEQEYAKKLVGKDFSKMSDKELLELYKELDYIKSTESMKVGKDALREFVNSNK